MLSQQLPLIIFHDRRQLLQISNHQQLHPTKRFLPIAIPPQSCIHRIQQISTHHTDLINNQQIHTTDDIPLFFTITIMRLGRIKSSFGHKRSKRQLKERMNRYASRIDSCNPCRSQYDHAFGRMFFQSSKKCRFPGSCFSGKK